MGIIVISIIALIITIIGNIAISGLYADHGAATTKIRFAANGTVILLWLLIVLGNTVKTVDSTEALVVREFGKVVDSRLPEFN